MSWIVVLPQPKSDIRSLPDVQFPVWIAKHIDKTTLVLICAHV
jgi:hypothetical protein